MYCKYCGKETENENSVCNECIKPQSEPVKVEYDPTMDDKAEGTGLVSLVLGISSLVLCNFVCGILAVFFGNKAMNTRSEKKGKIGKMLGILSFVLFGIVALIGILIFFLIFVMRVMERF